MKTLSMFLFVFELAWALLWSGFKILFFSRPVRVPSGDVFTVTLMAASELVGHLTTGSALVGIMYIGNVYLLVRFMWFKPTEHEAHVSRYALNNLLLMSLPVYLTLYLLGWVLRGQETPGVGLLVS